MPLGLLAYLGLEELLHRPDVLGSEPGPHGREERLVPGQQPRFQQRRHDTYIADALVAALADGAHAVTDLETYVPEEGHQALHCGAAGRVG